MLYTESDNMKRLRLIVETMDLVKSKQNQIENMFSNVREFCQDGYWDWNIRDNYKYLTPSLKAQLGYKDDEIENVHRAIEHLIIKEDLPIMLDAMDKHFESRGRIPFRVVIRYKHKLGHIIKILCRGRVVEWSDEGEPLRMVGSHVDVTDIIKD